MAVVAGALSALLTTGSHVPFLKMVFNLAFTFLKVPSAHV